LRLTHPAVVRVARDVGRSPAQVLLRWGIQHGHVVLPKSTKAERIAENGSVFDFSLDSDAMRRLDGLEEGLVTGWNPATQA
jgi:diketogulonate reductase-like aldo/keto reductase